MSNENEPNINIQNGEVNGTLEVGQPFYWYNPTNAAVSIGSCAPWCAADTYDLPAGPGYTEAQMLEEPNTYGLAWWDSDTTWDGPGKPHVTGSTPGTGPNTPNINIETGVVTGALEDGQTFYWYNPTQESVDLLGCGTWVAKDEFKLAPGYNQTSMLLNPNEDAFSWTESPNEWNTPGMPHVQNPPTPTPLEKEKKEVA